ncbi:MAG: hypothetical protein EP332_11840 [Bacteroidetes bacterium]|nr:MAG: hypothetical protein EP332_11840 [Bacteroidota bacterium]
MNRLLLTLFALCSYFGLQAQSAMAPTDAWYYNLVQRLEIKSGQLSPYFHSSIQPISREQLAKFAVKYPVSGNRLGVGDYRLLDYLLLDNADWSGSELGKRKPLFGFIYPSQLAILSHKSEDFEVFVNPILNLQAGRDWGQSEDLYTNTRGVEVRGSISKKLGFYTMFTENQTRAASYLRDQTSLAKGVFPSAGLTKGFKGNGYDFLQARGYITFTPIKNIHMQFGHDRNFIGDGYRSMILSDFGKEYLFLKVNTKVWKLNYQNLFAEMVSDRGSDFTFTKKKYIAMHHLSMNLFKNLQVGLFETIVFDRTDSNGVNRGFELNYLNPIIFYRSVEHGLNSSDNAMIGTNFKWNFLKRFSLYGQLTLDELKFGEYTDNKGWWGNKYAAQLGLKYVDAFFIPNLDAQYEFNVVRPYTFTHFKTSQNYTHFNTPLGHPLGANFREHIAILRYRTLKKLHLHLIWIHNEKGLDNDTSNWGGNILTKTYLDREQEYGNNIAQGILQKTNIVELQASWMVFHNVWIEAAWLFREARIKELESIQKNHIFRLGFRMNIAQPRQLF